MTARASRGRWYNVGQKQWTRYLDARQYAQRQANDTGRPTLLHKWADTITGALKLGAEVILPK